MIGEAFARLRAVDAIGRLPDRDEASLVGDLVANGGANGAGIASL
jgi:hypothetical protein